jgi:high-affinity Fe2+/Pb2+ permease
MMSSHSTINKTYIPKTQVTVITLKRLPQYIFCGGLGILGGAIGVALAIGLTIVVQAMLSPTVVFSPNVVLLSIVATLFGVGASWLLGQATHRILPSQVSCCSEQNLQVILIFSVFTSLVETILFVYGL